MEQTHQNVAAAVDARCASIKRTWIRGNNSGDAALLSRCESKCEALRDEVAALLAGYGIRVDWPGLAPTFSLPMARGTVTFYSVSDALRAAVASRAAA
jgi:hypothetical protein